MASNVSIQIQSGDAPPIILCGTQTVGRSKDSDIVIEDSQVSRKHAKFVVNDGEATVEDLGSVNGTTVNGQPVTVARKLCDGDIIQFDKASYVVTVIGANNDLDATIVASIDSDQDDKTVLAADDHKPAASTTSQKSVELAAALPGSWVDAGTADSTMVMSLGDINPGASSDNRHRGSDLPHLVVLDSSGARVGTLELKTTAEQDVWELGRDQACELCLNDPSVSERHAQLIHTDGQWRIVNLVSTNGIFVNAEKSLTAYLGSGDEIQLGAVTLIFYPALEISSDASSVEPTVDETQEPKRNTWVVHSVLLVALLVGLALLFTFSGYLSL